MKDCPKREDNENYVQIVVALDEDGYKSIVALVVSSFETEKNWVLDSGCSYHMCSRKVL